MNNDKEYKAVVLLKELPVSCNECPCAEHVEDYCAAIGENAKIDYTKIRPDCPVRPIPCNEYKC